MTRSSDRYDVVVGVAQSSPRATRLVSLKAVLKGGISLVVSLALAVLAYVFAVLRPAVVAEVQRFVASNGAPPTQEQLDEILAAVANAIESGTAFQIGVLAVLCVCSGWASCVAATSANASSIVRIGHGFLAITGLYLLLGIVIHQAFPDLPTTTVDLIDQWEITCVIAASLVGGIMGSEG